MNEPDTQARDGSMTMDETAIDAAAAYLAQARLGGAPTAAPPAHLTPGTEAEGYAVQAALHGVLGNAGFGRLAGHKIGCTTPVMQAFLDIDHPCGGEIFASMVFRESVELPLSRFHGVGVECETPPNSVPTWPVNGAPTPGKAPPTRFRR
jgi:2-keto-4-pentenoate hydratase